MSHWLVEAISLTYEARGLASPLGIRAHSTRAVASSQAFLSGSSMDDIQVHLNKLECHGKVNLFQ